MVRCRRGTTTLDDQMIGHFVLAPSKFKSYRNEIVVWGECKSGLVIYVNGEEEPLILYDIFNIQIIDSTKFFGIIGSGWRVKQLQHLKLIRFRKNNVYVHHFSGTI